MFICPNCGGRLARGQNQFGISWGCAACGGRTASLAVLRKAFPPDVIDQAWTAARAGQVPTLRRCPTCNQRMAEVPVRVGSGNWKWDVCKICQFVWFDPKEYEAVPSRPGGYQPGDTTLPQAAREALALHRVEQIAEQARAADRSPDETWKTVPALFGFPVESETTPLKCWPWLTWGMAAIIAIVSLCAFTDLEKIVNRFGLIPAEAWRYGGATSFTSFFLHGGVLHLLGNLYFLLIFGDNVEDYLGRWRWLVLLFSATFVGDMFHLMAEPNSTTPCIGASGGISGLIAFYALQFPRARLGFLFRYFWRFHWLQLPAWGAFVLWILLQGWGAYEQIAGFSNISALAHLGGAAVGFVLWLCWRNLDSPTNV